jgi:hypothetical protein
MKTFTKESDVTLRYIIIMKEKRPSYHVIDKLIKSFPNIPNNKKKHVDLFDMKYDKSNIVAIGEENEDDYMYLDDGEKIYIGDQKSEFEQPADMPHIILEDGTILYDQTNILTKSDDSRNDIVFDDTELDSDDEITSINKSLSKMIPLISKTIVVESNFTDVDIDGIPYVELDDGTKIYDIKKDIKTDVIVNKIIGNNNKLSGRVNQNVISNYAGPTTDVNMHIKKRKKHDVYRFVKRYLKIHNPKPNMNIKINT